MNNEVLTCEEYNNGGIYNAPHIANFSSYLPIFTSTNTSTGFGPIITEPKLNTVELEVKETINTDVIHQDPSKAEEYVRRDLAQKLAEKLIEEDLIQIYADFMIDPGETEFRAKIKVVQE
jgi:hypothetical protein